MALGDGGQLRRRRNFKIVLGYERSVTRGLPGFGRLPPKAHEGKRRFTKVHFRKKTFTDRQKLSQI